jgi:N,N'-diacetylbacillosaminyl-diphospho-undecaprenol alpha-1,3-N-acetylgalactosaminyltransferase
MMICNTDGALYVFRRPIIDALLLKGYEVVTLSSESKFGDSAETYVKKLASLGVRPLVVEFDRHSISPLKNLLLLRSLYRAIRAEAPDIVHSFTHKPAILGTIAAYLARTPRIFVTITGLGLPFASNGIRFRLIRLLLSLQYRVALRFARAVFYQNQDDLNYFVSAGIVPRGKAVLTYGSGIDVDQVHLPSEEEVLQARKRLEGEIGQSVNGKKVVLYVARVRKEKGFFEYYRAAQRVSQQRQDYVFVHLGLIDNDGSCRLDSRSIGAFASEHGVHYLGFKENALDYMRAADIVTLPSYREGMPRSLIEALALGKFLVTTDMPGCRETVIDGSNGYLCRVRDAASLARKFLDVGVGQMKMARSLSRRLCEVKFDAKKVVEMTLGHYFR